MRLTPKQKETVETMKARGWRIRSAPAYGKEDTYFWDDPQKKSVNAKILAGLIFKGVVVRDRSGNVGYLWKLALPTEDQ